jgi:hypothetical protein
MESYIIQVILFQLAFLLVYEFLLKKETFFNYNRAYLLLTPVLAFLLPIINVVMLSDFVPQGSVDYISRFWLPEVYIGDATQNIQQLPALVLSDKSHSFNWIAIIYGIGAIASIGIIGKKLFNLRKLFKFNVISEVKSFKIIEIPSSKVACTFNKTIFLGEDLTKIEKEQIVEHELIHVQQKHSYDLVYFEILKIIFWFNPLIYIYQNRIDALHEFIADSNAVKTIEKRSYYEQLLNTAFNTQNISFINQFFNHSLIKKRIVMLQKSKSKTIAKFKYLVVLPLVLMMLTIVSCSQDNGDIKVDDAVNQVSIENELIEFLDEMNKKDQLSPEQEAKFLSLLKKREQSLINSENKNYDGIAPPPPPPPYSVDVPFAIIEQVPLFPGCENLASNEEQKKCMTNKITDFVGANFDTKIGKALNLTGVNRVIVQFKIDENGNVVDVKSRAPHPKLEEEAKRVINSLPQMTPGEQNGKAVGVMYSLPIVFQVNE